MYISYEKITEEIFKFAKGLGYTIKLFDKDGSGPISNPRLASYIFLEDEDIMFSMPDNSSSERDEIFAYSGNFDSSDDQERWETLLVRVKKIANQAGVGVTVRSQGEDSYIKTLVAKIRGDKEEAEANAMESISAKPLSSYLNKKSAK